VSSEQKTKQRRRKESMPYDAVKMKDWQISEAAEKNMPTPDEWREKLGLQKDELIPFGRLGPDRLSEGHEKAGKKKDGKYIEVTAITPTPLGEGEEHHLLRP
jgi:formyltetrahydrofolate synthetase